MDNPQVLVQAEAADGQTICLGMDDHFMFSGTIYKVDRVLENDQKVVLRKKKSAFEGVRVYEEE